MSPRNPPPPDDAREDAGDDDAALFRAAIRPVRVLPEADAVPRCV